MSFKDSFCPSPWFHMRINNTGNFEYCRWADKKHRLDNPGIQTHSPITWFQKDLAGLRKSLLDGQRPDGCHECYQVDQHDKVSGRQRQLLKIGVRLKDFESSMLSSPWVETFRQSMHNGETAEWPQDWQIDLGNYCNSACVFCSPYSSSKIATEFKRIGLIDAMPPTAWCNDRENLDKFIDVLKRSSKLVYLHFIGGETLITPAFKIILQSLIDSDLHQNISLGLTTNLTVWDQTIVDLLVQFKEVNLGLSIECVHELNDYVRYGGHLMQTMHIMEKWLEVARQNSWLTQLRITPTVLSIWHLDTIYEYAYNNSLSVESCNFITEPKYMRPSVLPADMRDQVKDKLKKWLSLHDAGSNIKVINTRHPDMIHQQIVQDAQSYVHYLETESDESFRLPDLVRYLKTLEQSRGNSIIEYLPEYEQLLRTAGY